MALIPDERRGIFTAFKEAISLLCGIVLIILMVIHTMSLIFSKEKETKDAPDLSFLKSTRELVSDKNTFSIIILGVS